MLGRWQSDSHTREVQAPRVLGNQQMLCRGASKCTGCEAACCCNPASKGKGVSDLMCLPATTKHISTTDAGEQKGRLCASAAIILQPAPRTAAEHCSRTFSLGPGRPAQQGGSDYFSKAEAR